MNARMPVETDFRTKAEEREALKAKLLQEREELGDEWLFEEFGMPPAESAVPVSEQWNRSPRELVSIIQFFDEN